MKSIDKQQLRAKAEALQSALEATPDDSAAYRELGEIRLALDEYIESERMLSKALELDPLDVKSLFLLGSCQFTRHRFLEAESSFQKAIGVTPDNPDSYDALGQTLRQQGRPQLAVAPFRRVTELAPKGVDGYRRLGEALSLHGDRELAEAAFRTAIELRGIATRPDTDANQIATPSSPADRPPGLLSPPEWMVPQWLARRLGLLPLPQPALSQQQLRAILDVTEIISYDFGLLISGRNVVAGREDLEFRARPEILDVLKAQLDPFLATQEAMQPNFGTLGGLQITLESTEDERQRSAVAKVFAIDHSTRESWNGGRFRCPPRFLKWEATIPFPYDIADSLRLTLVHGRPSTLSLTKPTQDVIQKDQPPAIEEITQLGKRPIGLHHSETGQKCIGAPDCIRSPVGGTGKCIAHLQPSLLASALTTHEGPIDARAMYITTAILDGLFASVQSRRFTWPVSFDYSVFESGARFDNCYFAEYAGFEGAAFSGQVSFSNCHFARGATFSGAKFRRGSSFYDARFQGPAMFHSAEFHEATTFSEATFHAGAGFEYVRFGDQVDFDHCHFRKDLISFYTDFLTGTVTFAGATFERATQLGPMLVLGECVFDGAVFIAAPLARIEVTAEVVSCVGTQFVGGVDLLLRRCDVILDGANFGKQSTITTSQLVSFSEESQPGAWNPVDARVRVISLQGARVGQLLVSNVDLRPCHFDGAHELDRMRIEGTRPFAEPPGGWWRARRPVLAEEWEWRSWSRRGGPRRTDLDSGERLWWPSSGSATWETIPAECIAPDRFFLQPEPVTSQAIEGIYRALRKGREDNRDQINAADFYYSEMEMRRQRDWRDSTGGPSLVERGLLRLFWMVSGYDVKPVRSIVAYVVAVMLFTGALYLWGFYSRPPGITGFTTSVLTSLQTSTAVLTTYNQASLNSMGQLLQVLLRVIGPVLLALTALSVRNRVRR